MLDDCLKRDNYINKEYDSIWVMIGTNYNRHNESSDSTNWDIKNMEQKLQTGIKILEIS